MGETNHRKIGRVKLRNESLKNVKGGRVDIRQRFYRMMAGNIDELIKVVYQPFVDIHIHLFCSHCLVYQLLESICEFRTLQQTLG